MIGVCVSVVKSIARGEMAEVKCYMSVAEVSGLW